MYLNINDLNIYYEKYGSSKQTIIILPGWGNNRSTFNYLISSLKNYFTIYILDYPGFGKTNFKTDLTIFDYASIIKQFIIKLSLENSILIGHSFGGRIISLLSNYNLKIKKIILIDVAGINQFNLSIFIKKYLYKFLKKISFLLPKKLKKKYLKYLFNKFSSSDYKSLNSNMSKTFQNIIKVNLKEYYQNITQDTLILWGEFDNITPLKIGKKLAKLIKNSCLIKIKNTKHFPYLEKPYLVSKIIFTFIKKDII